MDLQIDDNKLIFFKIMIFLGLDSQAEPRKLLWYHCNDPFSGQLAIHGWKTHFPEMEVEIFDTKTCIPYTNVSKTKIQELGSKKSF